ncbi:putative bifunctional diguanylate cyclase/phosphodiesterase [Methylobrevis albus]|uniref:EAL domain-containing protein n=1 Tax=Methylobrevis albus TaxID=2793297 RepID=A0A931I079_9HYPH|nr:EAL domain-containing protein [Methylobrevis albus]MBH0236898.1 EAL domain-containing protein [Methylobrevis albus]
MLRRGRQRTGTLDAALRLAAAEQEAQRARDQLRAAIEAMPEGVVFLDEDGRYILWNRQYAEIYAGSADLFKVGELLEDQLRIGVARGQYPEAVGREEEWLARRLALLANPGGRHEQLLADGRWIMIEERRTDDGGTIGIRVDITEMKQREASFRLLFDENPLPMCLVDPESLMVRRANTAACQHYGHDDAAFRTLSLLDLHHPESRWDLFRDAWGTIAADKDRTWRQLRADGSTIEVTAFARQLTYEGAPVVLTAFVDVTERRRSEERMTHMARHDPLTGLPNRLAYGEFIVEAVSRARIAGQHLSVLLIDLDNFKTVNDTLGHSVGDELLQQVASRLRECLGDDCFVARLGGDEFAVLVPVAPGSVADEQIAARLIANLSTTAIVGGHQVAAGASIGIARMPADMDVAEQFLKNADLALYRAKAAGRGTFRHFEPGMDEQLQRRRHLEMDLRQALVRGELSLHYQPLVNLQSGRTSGYEALLRWTHPERGSVPPADFIALAEETGLIGDIGRFVLERACADAAAWPEDTKVAVNLSPAQFRNGGILATVMRALERTGLQPSRLELEITESLLMEKSESALATLRALRALGVGISMDDFGTGYSSLSYLRSFPFTKIKIDKSFIRDLHTSPDSQAIVSAIVSLGRSLKMTVIAEGIEDPADLALLLAEGCVEGQGYLFSVPLPLDQLAPHEGDAADAEDAAA